MPDPLILSWELRKCANNACDRQVKPIAQYCCLACSRAHGERYELDPYTEGAHWVLCHSEGCEQRHAQRGPWREPGMPPP